VDSTWSSWCTSSRQSTRKTAAFPANAGYPGKTRREENKELVLRYFEIRLLEYTGYQPQLRECVSCHRALEQTVNYFSPAAGGLLCPACNLNQPFSYPSPSTPRRY